MASQGFAVDTGSTIALYQGAEVYKPFPPADTPFESTGGFFAPPPKSVLGIAADPFDGIALVRWSLSVADRSSVSSGFSPILVEVCLATYATNPPGTNSTSRTAAVAQTYGRRPGTPSGYAAAENWTVEPTALTVFFEPLLPAESGTVALDCRYEAPPNQGFVIRATPVAPPSGPYLG